jgi:hypothetical protein
MDSCRLGILISLILISCADDTETRSSNTESIARAYQYECIESQCGSKPDPAKCHDGSWGETFKCQYVADAGSCIWVLTNCKIGAE